MCQRHAASEASDAVRVARRGGAAAARGEAAEPLPGAAAAPPAAGRAPREMHFGDLSALGDQRRVGGDAAPHPRPRPPLRLRRRAGGGIRGAPSISPTWGCSSVRLGLGPIGGQGHRGQAQLGPKPGPRGLRASGAYVGAAERAGGAAEFARALRAARHGGGQALPGGGSGVGSAAVSWRADPRQRPLLQPGETTAPREVD
mmetsp:Transcript_94297/g.224562  ORF Transcript_94297/g.224562 Transcript_94297/m.224562 type:complete len:201 (+) Transcript_94297:652-1254(+)